MISRRSARPVTGLTNRAGIVIVVSTPVLPTGIAPYETRNSSREPLVRLCEDQGSDPISISNAMSQSINARIQRIKKRACGFRSTESFREAILFHLGGLNLYPAGVASIHSRA